MQLYLKAFKWFILTYFHGAPSFKQFALANALANMILQMRTWSVHPSRAGHRRCHQQAFEIDTSDSDGSHESKNTKYPLNQPARK
jgi:hypothetical protein